MPATTIAFTFPGQGSQKPGMGLDWVDHPSWELVAEASAASGRDVEHLLLRALPDELKATRNSQIATLTLSLVVLDAVERVGVEAAMYAGHSLGEYTALVASGAVAFEYGVRLVVERSEAMQEAGDARDGSMAAVLGLDDDKVERACIETAGDVWVANYNAPGQVVIAGDPLALASAGVLAKELGAAKVLPIPVSGAFHTPFMSPARERLAKALDRAEFRTPDFPIVANVDAKGHTNPSDWPELLGAQLESPVRWRQCLYELDEMGATTFVELGGGNVLTGMTKRTIRGAKSMSVSSPDQLDKFLDLLHGDGVGPTGAHEGEHLFATERVVVSPSAGVFDPDPSLSAGLDLVPGQVLGRVGPDEVRSAFTGSIVGVLAHAGERVTISQPIAWLRTA